MKQRNRIKRLEARRRGYSQAVAKPSHDQKFNKPGSLKK